MWADQKNVLRMYFLNFINGPSLSAFVLNEMNPQVTCFIKKRFIKRLSPGDVYKRQVWEEPSPCGILGVFVYLVI